MLMQLLWRNLIIASSLVPLLESLTHCQSYEEAYVCIKSSSNNTSDASPIYQDFDALRSKVRASVTNYRDMYRHTTACEKSIELNSTLLGRPVLWYAIQPCGQAGNMFSFYWEAISYCLEHGIVFGVLQYVDECPNSEQNMLSLYDYLPDLVIPPERNNHYNPIRSCQKFSNPFMSNDSYFWKRNTFISTVNREAVQKSLANHLMSSGLKYPRVSSNSVVIHYRCGDNLSLSKYYSLISDLSYINLLQENIFRDASSMSNFSEIIIITDSDVNYGQIGFFCWARVGHLLETIKSHFKNKLPVVIRKSTTVASFLELNDASVVVCSHSTFCFYATYGSNRGYLPTPSALLVPPDNHIYPPRISLFDAQSVHVDIEKVKDVFGGANAAEA